MSIKFICNDKTIFEIPYHIWLDIKSHIITSTFEYLLDNFEINKQKYSYITDINHPNYIGQYSSYYGEMMDLQYVNNEIMKSTSNNNDDTITITMMVHTFLKMCNIMNCVNSLYHFDVGGLHTLCSKSEHGGYYSPGNSLDVCLLLNIIKPFINNDDYEYFQYIYGENSMYDAFTLSHTSLQKLIVL
jgi:hypothetical protein